MGNERMPSWRAGTTRDAITAFLDAVEDVPVDDRVAYFDNDGTLWCERPSYVQFDFFVDALRRRVDADQDLADRPEFAALLAGDAVRRAHHAAIRLAAGTVVVAHFHGIAETAPLGPVQRGL